MSASNIVAAGGANASAFGPTAACPSIFHIFSVTDSRRTVRVLKRHTQFPREHESPSAQRLSPTQSAYKSPDPAPLFYHIVSALLLRFFLSSSVPFPDDKEMYSVK